MAERAEQWSSPGSAAGFVQKGAVLLDPYSNARCPAPLNSQLMDKVNHYNWTKQIDFSMGPSVKFVLAIIDSISTPKNGG